MILVITEVLALVAFAVGAVAAALNYVGGSTLYLFLQLWWQGCIKVNGIGFSPKLSAKGSALVQPERIGGHTIFDSKQVVVDSPLGRIVTAGFTGLAGHNFDCVISQPWLDWTAEEDGDSRLVRLLKEVGYIKEVKAPQHPGRVNRAEGSTAGKSERKSPVFKAKWQAEIRAYSAHLHLIDGQMDMSMDMGIVLGKDMRVKGLVGLSSIRIDAEERGESAQDRWYETAQVSDSKVTGRLKYPLALAAASENVAFELAGWRTSTGILLRKPILASLQLTPDIASYGLAKLSPLLHCALKLEEGDSITVHMSPTAMHLPAECYTVRLEPMKLVLATRGLLHSILSLLNLGKGAGHLSRLEAWTTALEADIYKDGLIVSKRMDIVVGLDAQQGKGVHLAAWGKVDTGQGNAIDMTLGIPGPSLLPLGLTDLPEDYVFMIPMRGTSQHPEIDIVRAGKQLTELVMKQHVSQGLPFMKGLFKSQDQKQASRKPAVVPPPAQRPFPWEMASSKAAQ